MKLNKKVVGIAALGIAGIMAVTAVTTNESQITKKDQGVSEAANTGLDEAAVAGVTAAIYKYQKENAMSTVANVKVEDKEIDIVSATAEGENVSEVVKEADTETDVKKTEEDTVAKKAEMSKQEKKWQKSLMADVEQSLNVRKSADENAEIVGKLYKGDCAKILKESGEWTKIKSGNVKGYVKTSYCVTGSKALEYAKENCDTVATVKTDGLRLRDKQTTESGIKGAVYAGTELKVKTNTKKKVKDGWVAVVYNNEVCFVSEEYVDVEIKTGTGVTLEEEAAAIAAEEEAKRLAEEEARMATEEVVSSSQSTSTSKGSSQSKELERKQGAAVKADADDLTLLATIIYCEAGDCTYKTKLAVGAVVMNRVKSSTFPNTIRGVIYQSGQFSPVGNGIYAKWLANGVDSSCYKAAQDALSGMDNTNGAKFFKMASPGDQGLRYDTEVFY